jgi:hypothetical protein
LRLFLIGGVNGVLDLGPGRIHRFKLKGRHRTSPILDFSFQILDLNAGGPVRGRRIQI